MSIDPAERVELAGLPGGALVLLGAEHGCEAHGRYNALLAELVSFERALERRHSRRQRAAATS